MLGISSIGRFALAVMVWHYFDNCMCGHAGTFAVYASHGEIPRIIGSTIPT